MNLTSAPAIRGWMAGSMALSFLGKICHRINRWLACSLLIRSLSLILSDSAPRHSWLLGFYYRLSDAWWTATSGLRTRLLAIMAGSRILRMPAQMAAESGGIMSGSLLGALARALAPHPYPVTAVLFLLVLWPFLPTTVLAFMIILLAAGRLILGQGRSESKPQFAPSPLGLSWVALGAAIGLGLAFSVTARGSLPYAVLWAISFLAAYLVMDALRSRIHLRLALWAIAISSIPVCLLGIWQAVSRVQTSPGWVDSLYFPQLTTRVFSVFESPIILGQFLAVTIPISVYLWLKSEGIQRMWLWAITSLSLLTLVLTYTRGSWLAALLATAILISWWSRRAMILFLVLLVVAPLALPEVVVERFLTAFDPEYGTNRYRMVIWSSVLEMIGDHRLTGIGPGPEAFNMVYPHYMIPGTRSLHSHNLFLQVALEAGIPGLLAFLWFFGSLALLVLRKASPRPGGKMGDMTVVVSVALGGLMIQALADFIWYSPKFMMFFWMLAGCVLASTQGAEEGTGEARCGP